MPVEQNQSYSSSSFEKQEYDERNGWKLEKLKIESRNNDISHDTHKLLKPRQSGPDFCLICHDNETYLSDGKCQEQVSTEGVGIECEAVVDKGGGKPQIVADQSFLSEVGPHEQLDEPVTLLSLS